MGVQIIRSTTPLTPVYDNTAGALVKILDLMLWNQLGATRVFNGTNKISYQLPNVSGIWLDVDDTNPNYAVIRCYESMVSSTLTNQFTPAAVTLYVPHGYVGGSPWRIISDFYRFYFFAKTSGVGYTCLAFGDYAPYRSGEAPAGFVIGETSTGTPTVSNLFVLPTTNLNGAMAGHYMPRTYNAQSFTQGLNCGKYGDSVRGQQSNTGSGGETYPGIANAVDLAPLRLFEPGVGPRGSLPGIWQPCQNMPFNDGDTFSLNSGAASGRAFEVVSNSSNAQLLVETSSTWGGF